MPIPAKPSRAVQIITKLVTEADLGPEFKRKKPSPAGMKSLGVMSLSALDRATKEAEQDGSDKQ